MTSILTRAADKLEDLAVIFQARGADGEPEPISASQAASIADGLRDIAYAIRIGDRQRLAALSLAGNPVGDGLTVVLKPFTVVEGGRRA
jgi:hypothetical protein